MIVKGGRFAICEDDEPCIFLGDQHGVRQHSVQAAAVIHNLAALIIVDEPAHSVRIEMPRRQLTRDAFSEIGIIIFGCHISHERCSLKYLFSLKCAVPELQAYPF